MNSLILRGSFALGVLAAASAIALLPPAKPITTGEASIFVESVPPAPLVLICPGAAIEIGGEDGTNLDSIERLGTADLALHVGDELATLVFSPESLPAETLQLESWAAIELRDSELEQDTDLLMAAQYQLVSNARNRGLLASNCAQPALEHTLVGGSLADGHETVLLLSNPGANEAGATVRLATDTGAIEASYSVPARSERIVPLAAIGAGESSIAVQISATQPLGAWLQHRASAGLEPLGISWVTGQPSSVSVQNIFGVVVRGTSETPAIELATPMVRVFNPGLIDAEVLIEVTAVESFGAVARLNVPAGRVRELAIEGLVDGEYSIRVSAESAIYAAVKNSIVVSSGAADFAWLNPAERFSHTLRFAAQPVKASLIVFNPNSSELELSIAAARAGGATATSSVTVEPFQQQILELEAGRSLLIRSSEADPLAATLRYLNGSGIGYWQPSPNSNLGSEIRVLVR